jgi:DNA-binding beta-propeller fold protein YncE
LAAEPPLVLEATIPLDRVGGRIDHMAVDLARKRLFVAELGNDTVDVIGLADGRVIHRISGVKEPQGVGYTERQDRLFVASAADGTVHVFAGDGFAAVATIPLGDDADNIRINPRDGTVVVGYGSGGLAIIDPATATKIATIALTDHPESFQIAPNGDLAYVNVPDAKQIAAVDLKARRQVATWKLGGSANFPAALDGANLLATVLRRPAKLVLIDTASGAQIASMPTCGDADDVFFDRPATRIYVSCGSGEVAAFTKGSDGFRPLGAVQTASGARTSLYVPDWDRLFVARRASLLAHDAAILVFRPVP